MKLRLNLEPRRRKHLPITVFVEPDHSAVFRVHAAVYLFPPVTRKKGDRTRWAFEGEAPPRKRLANLQKKKKMWGGGWKQRGKARRRLQCGAKKVSPSIPSPPLCALLRKKKKKRKNVASSACCACLRRTRPLQTLRTEKSEDEKEKF